MGRYVKFGLMGITITMIVHLVITAHQAPCTPFRARLEQSEIK